MTQNKNNINQVNQKYGYIRVSSKSQESNSSIESQTNELIRQGIPKNNLRIEVESAADKIANRPVFQKLIQEELQENDLLMVTKLDRCSRNTLEFLKLQDNLFQRNITFVALDIPYSNDLAVNKLIATSLSAIATFENDRRKERQREGILAAKQAGKYTGRKTVINKVLIDKVKHLKEKSNLSVTQIAKLTDKSRATIYKVLKDELGYVSNRLVKQEPTNEPK
jgi:DNA invertase Pin-like site-specific DNA recombinase